MTTDNIIYLKTTYTTIKYVIAAIWISNILKKINNI